MDKCDCDILSYQELKVVIISCTLLVDKVTQVTEAIRGGTLISECHSSVSCTLKLSIMLSQLSALGVIGHG